MLLVLLSGPWFFNATPAVAGGGPRNVLVVQNLNSTISAQIASHYVAVRGIPPENICRIRCSTAEVVSKAECENNIVAPIRAFLQRPEISDRIDYIVLTKGLPLAANYGYSAPLSVTSILTCVGEPPSPGYPGITAPTENPYGPSALFPVEQAFSHSDPYLVYIDNDFFECHLYLVTRLDGYTLADVLNLIDRSVAASANGPILLDRKFLGSNPPAGHTELNNMLTAARDILLAKGLPVIYDDTSTFIGHQANLMGYFSWGSNDPSYSPGLYRSNTFAPGSIADTFVSTSGRTFGITTGGQSLIADLIPRGACGVSGYVSEPYAGYSTNPDVLFDRYTSGYNMAESFYAATPELYWKSVVVGDPLMAPYAHRPQVSIPPSEDPLTGTATVSAAAFDPKGIAKVEFYFDDAYVGCDETEPYTAAIDTTAYVVGTHTLEAIAYQATPPAVQASCTTTVIVENPVSNLGVIADAFPSPDGQGVRASEKIVTVGTAELGGGECYIEEPNRSSGIRIIAQRQLEEGDVVTVEGDLTTDRGERSVVATTITVIDQVLTLIKPVLMPNWALGGGDLNPQTKGVSGGRGLRTMGLLVKTFGRVTYVGGQGEGFFYVDDGSALDDGSGHAGLKVGCRSLAKPQIGSMVAVTGVCACEQSQDRIIRLLKPRRQSDISPIAQAR